MALSACAYVIAGPCAIFAVPYAILRFSTAPSRISAFTPTSQTVTSQPKRFASTLAPVFDRVRLTVCIRVTDCGALATPSATTPLSAANTSSRVLLM